MLWGSSMVGFGRQRYEYASGRSGEYFAVGFAPRKAALTLYGLTYDGSNADLLARLGPHTTGKGCLYVKRLAELDRDVLSELIRRSYTANHTGFVDAQPGSAGSAFSPTPDSLSRFASAISNTSVVAAAS